MKKVFALLAVSAFALAFVACGKKAETAEETVPTEETAPAPAEEMAPADTVAADTTAN
jgi:ABC-type oligopeptide transport system substrate-binding subunit